MPIQTHGAGVAWEATMMKTTLIVGVVAALFASPLAAHHSFDGTFDRNQNVKLHGTVTEYQFANPHTYFVLTVISDDGTRKQWHVETTSAGSLASHGWTTHSIPAGQRLEVEGWPARSGAPYIRLRSMRHLDGRPVELWMPPGP